MLMSHQLSGVRWLFAAFGRGGGLLTDEPGLGKTLQVIVLLEALVRAGRVCVCEVCAASSACVLAVKSCVVWCGACQSTRIRNTSTETLICFKEPPAWTL